MVKVLSTREKLTFILTAGVIVFAVVFKFFLGPLLDRNELLNKEISITKAKLQKYMTLLAQKDYLKARFGKYAAEAAPQGQQGAPTISALSELQSLAKSSGVLLADVRPQASKQQNLYKETPIDIRVEGDIAALTKFIYAMENPLSLFKIRKLQIAARPNSNTLEGVLSVVRFSPQ